MLTERMLTVGLVGLLAGVPLAVDERRGLGAGAGEGR